MRGDLSLGIDTPELCADHNPFVDPLACGERAKHAGEHEHEGRKPTLEEGQSHHPETEWVAKEVTDERASVAQSGDTGCSQVPPLGELAQLIEVAAMRNEHLNPDLSRTGQVLSDVIVHAELIARQR